MRRFIATIAGSIVALAFAALVLVVPAQAKEVTVEAKKTPFVNAESIQATLTFDDTIVEGTPTRFTINATGCSREPEFLFNSLTRKVGNGSEPVLDFSYQTYSPNNTFEEQLHYGGTYELVFCITVYGEWNNGPGSTRPILDNAKFRVQFTLTAPEQTKTASEIADEVVAQCNAACKAQGDTSQYAKALWLNDWIIENTEYDTRMVHNRADSVFLDKSGTCEAYHEAYSLLLNKVGIETRRVDSSALNHVWTGAKLDGQWYNIDTTWNDANSYYGIDAHHLYFALPTSVMQQAHPVWDGTYNAGGTNRARFDATSFDACYLIKTGKIKTWSDTYVKGSTGDYSVKAHLDKRETSFSLPHEHGNWPEGYRNVIYPLVAHQLSTTNWGSDVKAFDCEYDGSKLNFTVTYATQQDSNTDSGANTGSNSTSKPSADSSTSTKPSTGTSTNTNPSTGANTSTSKPNTNTSTSTSTTKPSTSTPSNSSPTATASKKISGTWQKMGSKWWFRYDASTAATKKKTFPRNEFVTINGNRYHFDSSGFRQTGWQKISGAWYYFNSAGKMATGWQKVGGKRYYFGSTGKMATGWQRVSGQRYFFSSSGVMKTGWLKSGGKWFCLGSNGKMVTGWQKVGDAYYRLDSSGAMLTGWQKISGAWYYFNASGVMKTGWLKSGGKWYYLGSGGKMVTGWQKVGSAFYRLDSSGAMVTGWQKISGKWYYFNASGAMVTSKWVGNYWVGTKGIMSTSAWVDGGKYYVDANGAWVPGKRR